MRSACSARRGRWRSRRTRSSSPSKTPALAAGERKLKLKPKRKLLKETPDRFKVQLRVEATDGAGNSETVRKSIKV